MNSRDFFENQADAAKQPSLEERLELQQNQLTNLVLCEELLERENGRIAQALHNDLGQLLMTLKLDISLFLLQHKTDEALAERVNAMLALTQRSQQSLCGLIAELRSVPRFEQGLAAVIEALCREAGQRHAFNYTLTIGADCSRLDDLQMIAIVRILREALGNIGRHAAASEVEVSITDTADAGLQMQIRDNGNGFDVVEAGQGRHLGLMIMRENAFALGGELEIVSASNKGCTVRLIFPPEPINP